MSKLTLLVAFGAGYVLGARAGHDRYEQITERASKVWNSRVVQRQVAKGQDFAGAKTADGVDAVVTGITRGISKAFGGGRKK